MKSLNAANPITLKSALISITCICAGCMLKKDNEFAVDKKTCIPSADLYREKLFENMQGIGER